MIADFALYTARFVHFGAAMMLFGGALFPLYTDARAEAPPRALAWVALGSALAWAGCVVINIGGGIESLIDTATLKTIFFATNFGAAWLIHLVLGFALVVAAHLRTQRAVLCTLAGLNLASLAGIGHAAMDTGALGLIHPLNHALHLLAAGAWLGALMPLRRFIAVSNLQDAKQAALRFSRIGYGAVALVIITGLANIRWVTGAWAPSLGTLYGALLALKLTLVAALVALAAFNRVKLERATNLKWLTRSICIEHALFASILAAVSIFAAIAPR